MVKMRFLRFGLYDQGKNRGLKMNKSRVARDLWRKVFSDNLIDLRNSDQRKQVVSEFLNDPTNSKAGWKKIINLAEDQKESYLSAKISKLLHEISIQKW